MKAKIAPPQILVKSLLSQYGIRPSKQRGQNFLIDEDVYELIIATADLKKQDTVLEIGPGLGTLTQFLSDKVKTVVAVELDKKLFNLLQDRFRNSNIELINEDILSRPVSDLGIKAPYKVVANIPYNITSPIFKKFLVDDQQPESMTLLVQKEIGERVTAEPGQLSILGISVQLYSTPKYVATVPAKAFEPAPKVASCVIKLEKIHTFPFKDVDEKFFWRVVKIGFSAKRKKLQKNLTAGLKLKNEQINEVFKELGLADTVRAQELSIEDWYKLALKVLDMLK